MSIAYQEIGFRPGICPENNIIYFCQKHVETIGNKIALKWITPSARASLGDKINPQLPHDSINFHDFYEEIKRISTGLKQLGIGRGDRVIIFLPMSKELYETMFAVQNLGAVVVFLESWARHSHLGASVKVAAPKAMISIERAYALFQALPEYEDISLKIVVGPHQKKYDADLAELLQCSPQAEIAPVSGEESALITFTTGSSGIPKGANRTHQFLSAQHIALDQTIPYQPQDIDLPAFPVFSLNNLAAAVTTVIPGTEISTPTPRDPIILISQILSCQINCATLSLSMIEGISEYCQKSGLRLMDIRRIVTGGAPVSNDNLRLLLRGVPNTKVMVLYGSTEAEPIAHIEAQDILKNSAPPSQVEEGVNVGHFAQGLEYKFIKIAKERITLLNDNWQPWEISASEVGELIVSGPHVCRNYYNNEEATLDTKIFESSGKVWHRTGDLAYLDQHKQVWLVGRVHNLIFRAGKALFPVRAEIILKRLPFVLKAAYLGYPDKALGEKTFAIVSPRAEAPGERDAWLKEMRDILQSQNIPVDEVAIIEDVPMDPRHHSKVEYGVLRERIAKGEL